MKKEVKKDLNEIKKKIDHLESSKISKKEQEKLLIEIFTMVKILKYKYGDIKNVKEKINHLLKKWSKSKEVKEKKQVSAEEGYNLWSKEYDSDSKSNALIILEEPEVRKILPKLKGKKVLDVGCGTGRWTFQLARKIGKSGKMVGIEPNKGMLKKAREKARNKSNINLKKSRGDKLSLKDNSFDFIISALVMSHIKEVDNTIKEMSRVLRKNGEIIITTRHPLLVQKCREWDNDEGVLYSDDEYKYFIDAYDHSFSEYFKSFKKNNLEIEKVIEVIPSNSRNKRKMKESLNKVWGELKDLPMCLIFKLKKK